MATIINNPSTDGGGGMGAVAVALIIGVIILGALFIMYRIPAFNGAATESQDGPVINVPEQVDINVTGDAGGEQTTE